MRLSIECIRNPRDSIAEESIPALVAVARNAFGTEVTYEDVKAHVHGDLLYLIRDRDELIGFSSYNTREEELYLSGIVIRRDRHRKGIFHEVNALAIRETLPRYLVMRTQNPVVYAGAKKLARSIYPDGCGVPEHILRVARRYGGHRMDDDLVIRGCYGASLYDYIPEHSAKRFFDDVLKLDYERGDSIIIVGEL
jgi:hypothetical protein